MKNFIRPQFFLFTLLLIPLTLGLISIRQPSRTPFKASAAGSIVWQEDFETDLSNWTITASSGCKIQLSSSTNPSPATGNNLWFNDDGTATDCYISRPIGTTLETGKVSLWFYDNMSVSNLLEIAVAVKDNDDHRMHLGILHDIYPDTYAYFVDDRHINTQIPRSFGWHKFEFFVSQGQTFGAIDGIVLKSKGFSQTLRRFTEIKMFSNLAPGATRFDGITVESSTTPYQDNISFSSPGTSGLDQVFTTRIKSLTGQNYYQNIFMDITDTAPDESNADVSAWFAVMKDTSGTWKFYTWRWLGTANIGDPNINYKSSYAYDVGGYPGGTNNKLCTNTTRFGTVGSTPQSLACLDLNTSSVSWDTSTQELVINWHVVFEPYFIRAHGERREYGYPPSTGVRNVNLYLNIDEPLDTPKTPADVFTQYNWRQAGTFTVGTPRSHSSITPTTSTSAHTVFTTVSTHPADAHQITEAYIWFDEVDPIYRPVGCRRHLWGQKGREYLSVLRPPVSRRH